jgi:hypothetical protein
VKHDTITLAEHLASLRANDVALSEERDRRYDEANRAIEKALADIRDDLRELNELAARRGGMLLGEASKVTEQQSTTNTRIAVVAVIISVMFLLANLIPLLIIKGP